MVSDGTRRLSPTLAEDGRKARSIAGLVATTERFSKRSKTPAGGALSTRGLTTLDDALVKTSASLCVFTSRSCLELTLRELRSHSESFGKDQISCGEVEESETL